jgi:hypothetical protein
MGYEAGKGPGGGGVGRGEASVPAWPPPGFRHIFPCMKTPPPPAPARDPRAAARDERGLRRRMAALARAMHAPDATAMDPAFDNPDIPAGYTYLMQFVAHDLVNTAMPFWALGLRGTETRNLVAARLRLDALYGGGPAICPFAYAPGPVGGVGGRSRLRIAPMAPVPGDGPPTPLRDIPRVALDRTPLPGGRPPAPAEALVCDQRSDDNSNVSQVTVLFSAFHNAVVERLAGDDVAALSRYDCAREAVTLVYRRVVREDLLRRLLHPAVHAAYAAAAGADFLDRGGPADGMPLEFSHGAFRCGHAMVRDRYQINDASAQYLGGILRATSGGGPGGMPLSAPWIVRWSRFFDFTDGGHAPPTPSRALRPRLSLGLLDRRFFDAVDGTGRIGLAYRDLLGAGLAGLHGVEALWSHLRAERAGLAALSPLSQPEERTRRLLAWLGGAGVADPEARALAADPPLPFYTLFEAWEERGGRGLGVLGSVIVAEVILGALDRDRLPCEAGGGDTAAALARLSARWGDADGSALAPLAGIDTMPRLIAFAEGAQGLGADRIAFI